MPYASRKEMEMARRNEKYSKEMKEQIAAFILETGKSATKTAKEMGIDVNTVCRWVRDLKIIIMTV